MNEKMISRNFATTPGVYSLLNTETFENKLSSIGELAFDLAASSLSKSIRQYAISTAHHVALEDIVSFQLRDPAIRLKPIECLLSIHSTFFAVYSYRLAHSLLAVMPQSDDYVLEAMRLSFAARSSTGVEIHPDARIGTRCVIDHGWGTVIGQTVEIGDDAYILNNVTLGGRIVGNAPNGKRHPMIGHRVQISNGVRILGPVHIGCDCFIGPDVMITTDIAPGSRVLLRRENNISLPKAVAAVAGLVAPEEIAQ